MSYLAPNVYISGLSYLDTNGTRLDITHTEAATYTDAQTTYTMGSATIDTGSATPGDPDGYMVIVPAITNGNVTSTGSAAFWAIITWPSGSELLASGSLSASQNVTNGNTFTLTSFNIRIPAPA